MAAKVSELSAIHKALATTFLKALEEGVRVEKEDKEGNVTETFRALNSSELAVIVAFLKNNNITASVEDNNELMAMAETLRGKSRNKTRTIEPVLDEGETTWQ